MRKCTYCGKEYADDATVCELDAQPLVDPTAPPPPREPPKPSGFSKEIKTIQVTWIVLAWIAMVVGGGLGILFIVAGIVGLFAGGLSYAEVFVGLCFAALIFALGRSLYSVARGFSARTNRSRQAGVWTSVIFLFLFPLGTIFGVIWLAGLLSSEAKDWFSGRPIQDEQVATTESDTKSGG